MKRFLLGAIRVVMSFWFAVAVLLAIAASCFWRSVSPGPSKLEALADEIRDPAFRAWYADIRTEREKAAVRTALDAYSRHYGSAVWADEAAKELDNGKPRYFDLAELAFSIEGGDDRIEFAEAHAAAYSAVAQVGAQVGAPEIAAAYADHLSALREKGGRDWRVVRGSPIALAVHAATDTAGRPELWTWYLDNRGWADDFLCAVRADPEGGDRGDEIVALLEEFRRRPKLFRMLRDEVAGWAEGKDVSSDPEASEFLAAAAGTVSLYAETFEVLCDAGIPFGEALDVLANNIADLDFETPGACRETGVELASLYRSHRAVWDAAAVPGGSGAVRFFRDVPQHAEAVLALFGEADVVPFLMQNYADSRELLAVAAESIARYQAVGWAVLAGFAGNGEFRQALLHRDVGHLVVPYVALKGGDSSAVSQCLDDPRWVKRYLNPDGSFKPEAETIAETLPFVGGIVTVLKHQVRGEPVTMGEVGWAVFDVVDDVVTVAAVVGATVATGGTATPAVVAAKASEEAALQAGRQGAKVTIKQGAKQLAKQSAKAGGKYAAKKGGKLIVRNGVERVAGRESKALARRSLVGRLAQTTAQAGTWTMKMAGKSIRVVASPVAKTVAAWGKLPPAARRTIVRATAAAMFFVALSARTLPRLPVALQETLKRMGAEFGRLLNGTVKGMADGFVEAVKATVGLQGASVSANIAVGCLCVVAALWILVRHRRRNRRPARLA